MKTTQRGFTLIELLVTAAVLVILVSLGVPNLTNWIQDSRVETTAQNVSSILKQARSEAVARQNVVTVDWSGAGIDMYTDNTAGGNSAYNAGDGDLYIKDDLTFGADGVNITTDDNNTFISFRANGTLNEAGDLVIAVCDSRGEAEGWDIDINPVGRVSVSQPSDDCTLP